MADGMRGQFVYVDRPRRTVVVKTSAWPYDDAWWDRQCRDLSLPGAAGDRRGGGLPRAAVITVVHRLAAQRRRPVPR